ncbi:MAG: phospholipase D family protein, partial [Gammaproteobacteria bacterium]|nr:phospholipase D family protein [Gammaproteobacteria bacterium]
SQARGLMSGIVVMALIGVFVVGGWYTLSPRPVPSSQQTACWQPDEPIASLDQQSNRNPATQSGFLPIHGSVEALAWRIALTESAQSSIDAQYFIWNMDEAGKLLLERLLRAADRGVKVRLLIDDLMGGLDKKWILANTHPNVEVRLFNPFRTRGNNWLARGPEWFFNITRLNHRMHNKLFMVDREMALIGGRNIANEYFGLGSQLDYRDFDLLASGPIARQLDESFETFWNSVWTYSPKELTEYRAKKDDLKNFRRQTRKWLSDAEKLNAILASYGHDWSLMLAGASEKFIKARARVVYDCPPGTLSQIPDQRVVTSVRELLDATDNELFLVSPYVVLSSTVRDRLYAATGRGVSVRLLTNSLEAADVNIAFGAYAKRRNELLNTGIDIYEMKAHGEQWQRYRTPLSSGQYLSMHAKMILFDDDKLMVGSLNLDPRSKYLNTEIALLIRSKELAASIMDQFDRDLAPPNSWRVHLDDKGSQYWESGLGKFYDEPARSFLQSVKVFIFSLLPIDSQL